MPTSPFNPNDWEPLGTAPATFNAADWETLPADEEAPGLLGTAWNAIKRPAVGALELVNRPAEFVAGTVGGTLQTGSLGEGLKRGTAALLEPDLVDSQIRESFSKVLEEQAPDIAKAHPLATAVAGFAGDVVLDPLNLLAGAGFLRKGGMSALKGLGASEQAAKRAMLVPVGEAFQQGVSKLGDAATAAAAKSPLITQFMPDLPLRTLKATGKTPETAGYAGLSAADVGNTSAAMERAALDALDAELGRLFPDVTPEEARLISFATAYPGGPESRLVTSDPRLSGMMKGATELLQTALPKEQAAGIQPLFRELPISRTLSEKISELTKTDRAVLQRSIRTGDEASEATKAYMAARPELQALQERLMNKMIKRDPGRAEPYYLADPKSLSLNKDGIATVDQAVPNYLPVYTPGDVNAPRLSSDRARYALDEAKAKSISFETAVNKLGAEADIRVLVKRRLADSIRSQADTQLLRTYSAEFGREAAAKGYRTLSPATISRMPAELADEFRSVHLPDAVVNSIEHYSMRMADPAATEGLFRRGTRLWKTMATSLGLPAHQANNFLGNITNMYAGGNMSPVETINGYHRAFRALKAGDKPSTVLGAVTVGGRRYQTDAELVSLAREMGAIGGQAGQYGVEIGRQTEPTGLAALLSGSMNPLNPDLKAYERIREFNQTRIEDPAKLALFVHELKQGKSAEQAALTVRKVLFDYNELTPMERQIREYVPFFTWMRKNIPLQLATLVERPSKVSHQGQFLNLFREWSRLSGDDQINMSELPEYVQTGEYIPIPTQLMAGSEGSPVTARARLPFMDIGALNPVGAPRMLAERLSPFIKVPVSLALGQDISTGQTLAGMRRPDFLGRLLPTPLGRAVETEEGLQQPATAKLVTGSIPVPGGAVLRSLFPSDEQENISSRMGELLLRSLGATPRVLTPEVYQQALEELKRQQSKAKTEFRTQQLYER